MEMTDVEGVSFSAGSSLDEDRRRTESFPFVGLFVNEEIIEPVEMSCIEALTFAKLSADTF